MLCCCWETWLSPQSTGVNIEGLHTDSVLLIARCHSTPNLAVFNQNCNEIYALYASAHLEWNAVLITSRFQLEWICYITPHHLRSCAYIKPHPIGWALRWNIMQIPNNKCTWLNSLSQQPEPCAHTVHAPRVCACTCTLSRAITLCLLTAAVSARTSGIKTVRFLKLTATGQSCSALHLHLKKGK